ncbi:hypothetical protein N7532_010451 [Penicillium argentinense]|uniref:Protein phosphatase n=1 Tax=Penicillium argentinense TaxID=1131581 RepID=A0A9W9JY22_9EURO|nr:uncharacterized protein N7532_010451 [Penicillium argentinense]KAJ5085680.1 hypothetical protein N7532_010451 [Penicillium argentinense]
MLAPVPRRACSSTCSLQILQTGVRLASTNTGTFTTKFCTRSASVWTSRASHYIYTPISGRKFFHSTASCANKPSSPAAAATTSEPRISYRVAVSSSGKGRRFHPLKNAYNFDPTLSDVIGVSKDKSPVARRKARPDSGEDAFFVSRIGSTATGHLPSSSRDSEPVAFAVADGVGGWTESRVDPADFSHGLCGYMAQTALSWHEPADKLRPKSLLQAGYDQVVADPSVKAGGSTASVGIALPNGKVELANLGDSGSVLLRLAAVHTYSTPQTHGFNTPYQLSIIPPRMRAQASVFGGAFLEDFPRDAAVTNVQMQHGDVLMLATDGVFDNLNNQDILKLVTSRMIMAGAWTAPDNGAVGVSENLGALTMPGGLASAFPPQSPSAPNAEEIQRLEETLTLQSLVAASISGEAKLASVDFRRDGPFAKEAQRYYPGDYYRGGKVDDICTLILVAVDENLKEH